MEALHENDMIPAIAVTARVQLALFTATGQAMRHLSISKEIDTLCRTQSGPDQGTASIRTPDQNRWPTADWIQKA